MSMKKTLKGLVAAAIVVAGASSAKADLTVNGAVGLPLNPTAQIPAEGGIRVQGNYYDLGNVDSDSVKVYGLYGAGRAGDMLEINGGIEKFDGPKFSSELGSVDANRTSFAIGAKYLFTRESDDPGVRIAAGVGYNDAQAKNLYAYVVGTKYFGELTGEKVPITGHLGLRYDRFDYNFISTLDSDLKSSKASIFAGVEVPIVRNGDVSFVGELQSKNSEFGGAKSPFSASVRYRPQGQGFAASIGLQRGAAGFSADSNLFVQLGYTFDTGSNGQ